MAQQLGIKLALSCCEKTTAETAGGAVDCWVYPQGIKALIAGEEIYLKASFCDGLKVPLLGRRDFFNAFKVMFDQRGRSFTLEACGPIDWAEIGATGAGSKQAPVGD
jgi:hypothetical protein